MRLPHIPTRIPVGNFLPLRPFLTFVPIVVVLSAISAVDEFDVGLFLTWVAIHLVTIVLAGVPAIATKQVLLARGTLTISLWAVLGIAVAVGVGKATMTAGAEAIFRLTDSWTDNLAVRIVGATFTAVWVLVLTAYARTGLLRLKQSREELVRHNVATRLGTEISPLHGELGEPLEQMTQLRSRLASGTNPLRSAEIREVVDKTIRPLSRALWSVENARYPEITLPALLQLSLQSGKMFAPWIALVWASLSFTALAVVLGVLNSATYNIITGLVAALVWTLAAPMISRRISLAIATISVLSVLSVIAGVALTSLVIPGFAQMMTPVAIVAGGAWMALVVTGVSIIHGGIRVADVIGRDRASHSTQMLIERQANDLFVEENARKLATKLHGEIQSRLLGIAAAIDHRTLTPSAAAAELDDVIATLTLLNRAENDGVTTRSLSATEHLKRLMDSWKGLMVVTIDPRAMEHLAAALDDTPQLLEIAREGLTNAHRHGQATAVTIQFDQGRENSTLTIIDNGYGPRDGSPGLGTALLNRWAQAAWSLTAAQNGGAVLQVVLTSPHKAGPMPAHT